MSQNYDGARIEWERLAEKAIKKHDYEDAARFFHYVTISFGLANDESNQKKYANKTGECYLQGARKLEDENDFLKAILLCIKATNSFQEGGSEESSKLCDSVIRKYYALIARYGLTRIDGDAHNLKGVGDYFFNNGDLEKAIECYRTAAEKAFKEDKLALSGGLYRDVGDCYQRLKDFENAAKTYATAADMYFNCQEYFEAASHYCESGFLFIHVGRLKEASIMARKAGFSCDEGCIDILLNDLSYICRLLSERSLYEAEERWKKIRMKFKRSYIDLIDSCFRALREKVGRECTGF